MGCVCQISMVIPQCVFVSGVLASGQLWMQSPQLLRSCAQSLVYLLHHLGILTRCKRLLL